MAAQEPAIIDRRYSATRKLARSAQSLRSIRLAF